MNAPQTSVTKMTDILEALRAQVIAATQTGTPLDIRGGGTKVWYGQTPSGEKLDVSAYRGIIAYDPAELVITARAGTPLSEIEATLSACGQMLPFEPPYFGEQATLGGCIASGLAGPRRPYAGAPRDFILGAVVMNGHGEVLHFGGQVMKNVAGYDVSRMLAGALGTLGVMLELSIKVLPRPAAQTTLSFTLSQTEALAQLNRWSGKPLPLSASCWHAGALHVRLSGAVAAVKAACATMGGTPLDPHEAEAFWTSLREQTHPFFSRAPIDTPGTALWRFSVPQTAAALPHADEQLIEWGGAQRWWIPSPNAILDIREIREIAAAAGGHATLFRHGDKSTGVFSPLPPAVRAIGVRLQEAFDPRQIFNRHRLYAD